LNVENSMGSVHVVLYYISVRVCAGGFYGGRNGRGRLTTKGRSRFCKMLTNIEAESPLIDLRYANYWVKEHRRAARSSLIEPLETRRLQSLAGA
jgi:hypothetical protein